MKVHRSVTSPNARKIEIPKPPPLVRTSTAERALRGESAFDQAPPFIDPVPFQPPPPPVIPPALPGGSTTGSVMFGADGSVSLSQQTTLAPSEVEFESGRLGATIQAGPYAETEVGLEWNPSQPRPDGTYEVTVTYGATVGVQAEAGLSYGPFGVSGGSAAGVTGSQSYTLFLTPDQLTQVAQGTLPLPSIADPLSMPVGGGVTLETGAFTTETGSITYGPLTLSSEATHTDGYSVGVQRTGDTTVRVTVGPSDVLDTSFGVGLALGEHASLSLNRQATNTDENLVSVELDLSTPEGQAAYETFLRTGALPTTEGAGVSGLYQEQTYSYEGSLSAGLELGPFSVGGELWNENTIITRRIEDGVETMTATALQPNGNTITSSFIPSPDGNHEFVSATLTIKDPNFPDPVVMTVNGQEGFDSLRQAAVEQMQFAIVRSLSNELGMSQEETLTWMRENETYAPLVVPADDPSFSYEAFIGSYDECISNGWAMPDMPLMTNSLLRWSPGDPYLPVFMNPLRNEDSEALFGMSGLVADQDEWTNGPVPAPSLFEVGTEPLEGVEVQGLR